LYSADFVSEKINKLIVIGVFALIVTPKIGDDNWGQNPMSRHSRAGGNPVRASAFNA
jgi:hypothetical protein